MSETPDKKLDRVTDAIVDLVYRRPCIPLAEEDARIHIRRMLRDECSELWEESAAEADVERLKTEAKDLRAALERIMYTGCDCPAAMEPADFYRNGLRACVSQAAIAIGAMKPRNVK